LRLLFAAGGFRSSGGKEARDGGRGSEFFRIGADKFGKFSTAFPDEAGAARIFLGKKSRAAVVMAKKASEAPRATAAHAKGRVDVLAGEKLP